MVTYVETSNFLSSKARIILANFLSDNPSYNSLLEYPEFEFLTTSEKDKFRFADQLNTYGRQVPGSPEAVVLISVVAFGAIGATIGGFWGAVIGGVVGLVVGLLGVGAMKNP